MSVDLAPYTVAPGAAVDLAAFPTRDDGGLERAAARAETERLLEHLDALQERLYAEAERSLLVVVQAIDGGGKDSTIRRVLGPLNPQGVRVTSFKVPSALERAHDFLWRVHAAAPRAGHIAVFNRSHYEDVLVARVRELAPPEVVERRYEHIRAFERLLEDRGTRVVKLMLHISPAYQLERFEGRLEDPAKYWKFNPDDLDDRARWTDYMRAFEIALEQTSTETAPWIVVPAERRWFRNLVVVRALVDALEGMAPAFPEPTFDPAEWTLETLHERGRLP